MALQPAVWLTLDLRFIPYKKEERSHEDGYGFSESRIPDAFGFMDEVIRDGKNEGNERQADFGELFGAIESQGDQGKEQGDENE